MLYLIDEKNLLAAPYKALSLLNKSPSGILLSIEAVQ
jgi:hypothetical protein